MDYIGYVVVFWLIFCALVGWLAQSKGHSGVAFFFLSALLSPLIGLIVALAVNPNAKPSTTSVSLRKCPKCAEKIQWEATLCKHCGSELEPQQRPDSQESIAEKQRDKAAANALVTCPKCGSLNARKSSHCIICVADLTEAKEAKN